MAFEAATSENIKTLLTVGPQPPPVGGGTITFQVFLDEVAQCASVRVAMVNTSPPDYRKRTALLKLQTLQRAISITQQYLDKLGTADAIFVFASKTFVFTIGPILLLLARQRHKPFYLKPFGGDLDLYLTSRKRPICDLMLNFVRATDGVLVQTQRARRALTQLGCSNIHYVPGYRPPLQAIEKSRDGKSEQLRLIFLSHIRRGKGPLILLEALRLLAQDGNVRVACDFFGPIFEEDREAFLRLLEATPGARHCGVAEVGSASRLMAAYDALVLPTFLPGEGHPGAIIEAMQAGIPVISTHIGAISELITSGENGLLVPPQDSRALAEAIKRIGLDHALREQMAQASYREGQQFRADVVVPQMLQIIFPD